MADMHILSSFKDATSPKESKEEKKLMREQKRISVKNVVERMKEKGITFGHKAAWYKVGEKKRIDKPPIKFKVGIGKPRSGTVGAMFRVEF